MPSEVTPPVVPEGTPHDLAMAQKVDTLDASLKVGQEPPPQDPPADPPVTPPEETPADPPKDPEQKPEDPPKEPDQKPEETPAELDVAKMQAEFQDKGTLTEESFAALEKAGYPKALVEVHLEGLKAIAAQATNDAYTAAGGEQSYKAMTAWAATNLDAASIEAFDTAVGGTAAQRKQAIQALKASYQDANGRVPTLTTGATGGSPGAAPFTSIQEQSAAQRDPRYKSDPGYREQVYARIAASSF